MKKITKGFTLIELLIVISIIGVLTSLLMANFIQAKARARDAERKSDLRQIQSALELYRTDTGAYPKSGIMPNCNGSLTATGTTYIQKMPCDPLTNKPYNYAPAGAGYTLTACLENKNDSQGASDKSCGAPSWGYKLTNP